jgi:hypothetical protein
VVKKTHSDKNVVIVNAKTTRIGFLSTTYPGKVHDKKIAEKENISYPQNSSVYKDTGFQGYDPPKVKTHQPKKKPRNGELTKSDKRSNKRISKVRVGVEHALSGAKRSRIVKDVLRNTNDGFSDLVMVIACGLHNLRVRYRKKPLQL